LLCHERSKRLELGLIEVNEWQAHRTRRLTEQTQRSLGWRWAWLSKDHPGDCKRWQKCFPRTSRITGKPLITDILHLRRSDMRDHRNDATATYREVREKRTVIT
jgi:hypothetical protein